MKTQDSDTISGERTLIPRDSFTRIEGLPFGRYARKCRGQEGAMKEGRSGSIPPCRPSRIVLFQILLVGVTTLALVGVPSRRQVVQKTVLGIPDPNPLPYCHTSVNTEEKMSVQELNTFKDYNLNKCLLELIYLDAWTDKCNKCGYPKLILKTLHRDVTCTGVFICNKKALG